MRKRLVVGAAGLATAVVVALATPATMFECYNVIRSAQGNMSAARVECAVLDRGDPRRPGDRRAVPEGVQFVLTGLEDAGFRTDVLINFGL